MAAFILLFEALRDLLLQTLPSKFFKHDRKEPSFAFLVHPRDIADVFKKYPHIRKFPHPLVGWGLKHFWPVVVSEVEGLRSHLTGKPIRGWIITIPLTASLMMKDKNRSIKLIRRAIKLAYNQGANVIGLGALNASITYRGRELVDLLNEFDMGVTTGVGYTAYNISDLVNVFIEKFKLSVNEINLGVVGAAGSIAHSTIRHLLKNGIKKFILIDLERKHEKIRVLLNELSTAHPDAVFTVSSNLLDLKQCRIIVTATNTPDALIKSEYLSSGTIIIDDAQPSDVDREVILNRDDVIVVEGGVIEVRGINPHVSFGLKHKTDVFSCLAEVMVMAAFDRFKEKNFDYSSALKVEEVGAQGKMLGFGRAEFQNFQKVYTDEQLQKFYNTHLSK